MIKPSVILQLFQNKGIYVLTHDEKCDNLLATDISSSFCSRHMHEKGNPLRSTFREYGEAQPYNNAHNM